MGSDDYLKFTSNTNEIYYLAYRLEVKPPEIKQIIFNGPATIVIWLDGSKTVVKCMDGDTFNPETGVMMATLKKIFGNDYSKYKSSIKKAIDKAIWQKNSGAEE